MRCRTRWLATMSRPRLPRVDRAWRARRRASFKRYQAPMSDRECEMSTSSNAQHLRWGILGGGNIAQQFGAALATSANGTLVSVGTRSAVPSPPAEFDGARMVTGYDELLADA